YLLSHENVGTTGLVLIGLVPDSEITAAAKVINTWTVLLILIAIGIAIILGLIITLGIGSRITRFSYKMEKVARGELDVIMSTRGNDEIAVLGEGFNRMIGDLKGYISESVKNEKLKREMAINLLISQINPHVIYNTLNSVIYLAKENRNKDIVKMVESFINFLHNSIKIGDEGLFATIEQEVESITNYAVIQQFRYPDKFTIEWEVDKELYNAKVPRTIIQPLVENALFHGICPLDGRGNITISIQRVDSDVCIIVSDNGEGMEKDKLENIFTVKENIGSDTNVRSIGLSNIRERIQYLYKEKGNMIIKSTPGTGTQIELRIPL
ncbi:MAG: histidine kinase, partial [Spirochaetaceae bacterium]|nr:histidine kinase [Spirochaetaceae bacterium]